MLYTSWLHCVSTVVFLQNGHHILSLDEMEPATKVSATKVYATTSEVHSVE